MAEALSRFATPGEPQAPSASRSYDQGSPDARLDGVPEPDARGDPTTSAAAARLPDFMAAVSLSHRHPHALPAMLKQRQDGLVFLHGLLLDGMILLLFAVQAVGFHVLDWLQLEIAYPWLLYGLGVAGAMLWNHRALPVMAARLGTLSGRETVRLSGQQLCRLMAVLFAVGFMLPGSDLPRGFIAGFVGLAGLVLLLANLLLPRRLAAFLFRQLEVRTLVCATSEEARRLQSWLSARSHLGQKLAGLILPPGDPVPTTLPVLGGLPELRDILGAGRVNQIIIQQGCFTAEELRFIHAEAALAACRVRHFLDLATTFGDDLPAVECAEGYAFAAEAGEPLNHPLNLMLKRLLDLGLALPVVCGVLPGLILLVWIMQRRQSPGPVFYRQQRSGLNGRRFHIFKFRTMHLAGRAEEARQATRDDPRVFPFGGFLRRTSLDEFPQFLNVLLGDMSVSGPRPHLLEHDRQFAAIVETYYQRHYVKPGITGLAQSEGFRGEVAGQPELLRQRVARDLRYVRMWTLRLDLKIIAATAVQLVRPPGGAY
jgi:exopolysaccharide biosynthesis polyprenyl glycosylphosphotransferase